MTTVESVKICNVPGCDQPRMKRANGEFHTRCTAHMREYWKKANHGELDHSKKGLCLTEGCEEPRHTSKDGHVYPYCAAHQKEQSKAANKKQREKKHAAAPMTEAQQHAGFDRNPQVANTKGEAFKVCIIDYDKDTMTFVEGRVTRRCKTDALALLPGGWQILLDGHADEGYTIVQRGTPPPIADLDSRYDWSD